MSLIRLFPRPAELMLSIFRGGNEVGYVRWLRTEEDSLAEYWEAEGYQVTGDGIQPSKTRVCRQDLATRAARGYDDAMTAEYLEALIGRQRVAGPLAPTGTYVLELVRQFVDEGVATVRGTGIVQLKLPIVTFFRGSPPAAPALSQAKKRRGGLWIPAKRTRSNAVAFTRLRVPHK